MLTFHDYKGAVLNVKCSMLIYKKKKSPFRLPN